MPGASDTPAHRVFADAPLPAPGAVLDVDGREAHHALSVKRVRPGDAVAVLDGAGTVALAAVQGPPGREPARGERSLRLLIQSVRHEPAPSRTVEVWSAVPKGDRTAEMIGQLSQVGASAWRAVRTARAVADPRDVKFERLRRAAVEAMKQCGRAWVLRLDEPAHIADAVTPGVRVIVADAAAPPLSPHAPPPGEACTRVLIGPEGGFTPDELDALERAGAVRRAFGPHVMRIETAAVAAVAIVMADLS